jgi:hypothetical protein
MGTLRGAIVGVERVESDAALASKARPFPPIV